MMRRIVCIIEGHGEREAVPVLCVRIMRSLLGIGDGWYVDEEPVRQPRSRLVDENAPSPKRSSNQDGVNRALLMAAARMPDGILLLCDADDDCPAAWGPSLPQSITFGHHEVAVRSVMVCREYESWLLWHFPAGDRTRVRAVNPEQSPRNAKRALERLVPGYTPTMHQLAQTRALNLGTVWACSDSFDKLVRSLADLTNIPVPQRPSRPQGN